MAKNDIPQPADWQVFLLEAPLYEVASDENPEATDFKGRLFRTVEEQKYLLQLTESPTNSPVLLEINKEDILG